MERNKTFKKLLWLLGAVATVFAIVFAMGKFDGEKANAAVELNQNNTVSFIDSLKIMASHKDSTSEKLKNNDVYILRDGDKISVDYNFSFPDNAGINPGDTYTIYVPRAFKAYNSCDGDRKSVV